MESGLSSDSVQIFIRNFPSRKWRYMQIPLLLAYVSFVWGFIAEMLEVVFKGYIINSKDSYQAVPSGYIYSSIGFITIELCSKISCNVEDSVSNICQQLFFLCIVLSPIYIGYSEFKEVRSLAYIIEVTIE